MGFGLFEVVDVDVVWMCDGEWKLGGMGVVYIDVFFYYLGFRP